MPPGVSSDSRVQPPPAALIEFARGRSGALDTSRDCCAAGAARARAHPRGFSRAEARPKLWGCDLFVRRGGFRTVEDRVDGGVRAREDR